MAKIDPVLLAIISDLSINFSVFWFGLAIVSPIFPGIDNVYNSNVLTADILAGILSLLVGYLFRRGLP